MFNSPNYFVSIVAREDDGTKPGRIAIDIDLAVVRPAARTLMFPVATKLGCDGPAWRTYVRLRSQFQVRFENDRFIHASNLTNVKAAFVTVPLLDRADRVLGDLRPTTGIPTSHNLVSRFVRKTRLLNLQSAGRVCHNCSSR